MNAAVANAAPLPPAITPGRAPLIGVTGHIVGQASGGGQVAAGQAYLNAVQAAGGVPVILPPVAAPEVIAAALDRVDGVLFTGGKDIDPRHYGQAILNDTVALEPERDAFELPLARAAVARDLPVLAICRGCQVLNVALGGSLWQDLPAQRPDGLLHAQRAPRDAVTHAVHVQQGTQLAAALDALGAISVETNTFHHQATREVAPGLVAVAHADDTIVEALEASDRRFVVGVQWHPEHLAARRREHHRLFEAFVAAACGRSPAPLRPSSSGRAALPILGG